MIQEWKREQEQATVIEVTQSIPVQEDPDAWRDPFYGFMDKQATSHSQERD
jgi:regulation of enolase protein 1 (concanavalin A-like superfamily)